MTKPVGAPGPTSAWAFGRAQVQALLLEKLPRRGGEKRPHPHFAVRMTELGALFRASSLKESEFPKNYGSMDFIADSVPS